MKLITSSIFLLLSISTHATQHALVIGINKYPSEQHFSNLDAAVNDAQLIAKTLRKQGIILPENRLLLDEKATRKAFDKAWQNMLKQAQPGETLILSFAGHGSQNKDNQPFDEKDGKDESLLFYDYNGKQGFIIDDQLYSLFKEAAAYKIVVLIDACHSNGMVRARHKTGQTRTGKYNIVPSIPVLPSNQADENNQLRHVTYITAVSNDNLIIQETNFSGKQHGALSWYFAKALNGEADSNRDKYLVPNELRDFMTEKVRDKMNNQQIPKIKTGEDKPGIKLRSLIVEASDSIINIKIKNTKPPRDLKQFRQVESGYDLLFERFNHQIKVFNNTGDEETQFPYDQHRHWQQIINKHRLLKGLANRFNMQLKPIKMTLPEGDDIHKQGELLHFSIEPGDYREGLMALTLFNLAGNGTLQFVYPLTLYGDSYNQIKKFPFHLPPLEVKPPYGGDNLVAILCRQPAYSLHQFLNSKTNPPTIEQVMAHLKDHTCQIGQYGFYSVGR